MQRTHHSSRALGRLALSVALLLSAVHRVVCQETNVTRSLDGRHVSVENKLTGISLGIYSIGAPGVRITGENIEGAFKTKFGEGAGLFIGLGITPAFTLFAAADVAKQKYGETAYDGSFGLGHLELGARLNLASGASTTVPYLSASVGSRGLGARVTDNFDDHQVELRFSGLTYGGGGGLQYFLSPHAALDAGATLTLGKFDHLELDGTKRSPYPVNPSRSLRFRVGVTWHP